MHGFARTNGVALFVGTLSAGQSPRWSQPCDWIPLALWSLTHINMLEGEPQTKPASSESTNEG